MGGVGESALLARIALLEARIAALELRVVGLTDRLGGPLPGERLIPPSCQRCGIVWTGAMGYVCVRSGCPMSAGIAQSSVVAA